MKMKKWAFVIMRTGSIIHILNAIGLIFLPKLANWGEVMKCIQSTPFLQFQIHNRPMIFLFNYEWAAAFFGFGLTFWYLARFLKNGSRMVAIVSIIHGFTWICNLVLYAFMYPKDFIGITLIILMIIEIFIWLFPMGGIRSDFVD